jgi:hypothetical protein
MWPFKDKEPKPSYAEHYERGLIQGFAEARKYPDVSPEQFGVGIRKIREHMETLSSEELKEIKDG